MFEQSVTRALQEMAEKEQPHSRVSIRQALRDGRARLRRRRLVRGVGTPAFAAAAVLAIALSSTGLPAGSGHTHPQPGTYGKLAGGAFNPSYLAIRLGWLPAGAVVTGGQITGGGEALTAAMPDGAQWAVGVYAPKVCQASKTTQLFECLVFVNKPTVPLGVTLSITGDGPTVDGHRSLWLRGGISRPAGPGRPGQYDGTILAWQYAPGAWTVVQHVSSQRSAATLVRIARAVEYGQRIPVRFASQFTSLPRGWRISGLLFARDYGVYLVSTYQIGKMRKIRPTTPVFAGAWDQPLISISPATSASRCDFNPRLSSSQVTIRGYRFKSQRQGGLGVGLKHDVVWSYVCGNHVDGLLASIAEFSAAGPMGLSPTAVMERLKLLGIKPADWVTNPLP